MFLQKNTALSSVLAVFDVATWDHAGTIFWDAASQGNTTAVKVMTTWRLVTETLRAWWAEKKKVLTAVAQASEAPDGACAPTEKTNLIDF